VGQLQIRPSEVSLSPCLRQAGKVAQAKRAKATKKNFHFSLADIWDFIGQ